MMISFVVRTLNEARHLDLLLAEIQKQELDGFRYEVIIVDSGSTDGTLQIAERHNCRIVHIQRKDFSFGRSLNIGCKVATGSILVITSGHCIPKDVHWSQRLIQPLLDGEGQYSFGRQLGADRSHYSEKRIFAKYFPDEAKNGQKDFFCNNANAALTHETWEKYRFDEDLTGLEDMELAQRLVNDGGSVVYVPDAIVFHLHEESWSQIQRRFEREAIALQRIMPNIHVGLLDVVRYIILSILIDWVFAWKERVWFQEAVHIMRYRWNQYLGIYKGNNDHRKLSRIEKEKYFYPE